MLVRYFWVNRADHKNKLIREQCQLITGKMLLPVLDTCISLEKPNFSSQETLPLIKEQAIAIVVERFKSTGERDAALINIISKQGIEERSMALKTE
ncbi:hypothetical protein ACLKA6_009934 [Drosophila palustris]